MTSAIVLSSILISFASRLTDWNDQLLLRINSLAGRSWLFDSIVAFFQNNDLAKAGVIGCCFLAAWYGDRTSAGTNARRKILIVTLIASVFVIATTKTLSHMIFLPRPEIQTQEIYHLQADQLVQLKRMPVRIPLDGASQKDYRGLVNGDVDTNDLGSFPSDHAGFFLAISLGIWLASRRLGWIALAWTLFVILAGKMIQGQHTPLDIAAGGFVAVTVLSIFQFGARRWLSSILDKVSQLTLRHRALASALIFAVVFEVSSTLVHVRAFLGLLAAVRRHVLFGI